MTATTAPMGAGKWKPQYSEALEGADVVILPGSDDAGRKHAEMAARQLHGKAKSVRIVELPGLEEGEDVSDWLANGGTKEELRQLTAEADLYEPSREEPEALATPVPAKPLAMQEALGLTRVAPAEAISKLPDAFQRVLEHFDDSRERDVLLAGMLGVMSGCLPRVKGAYHRNRYAPNLFFFISAPAGSGKGVLKRAREIGEKVHAEIKRESIDEIRAWEEAKENGEQDLGPKPSERWPILPANISAAAFMKALDANDGWGIMIETEADTLTQTLDKEWGKYSDMLRKAHPHEAITNLRMEGGREIRDPCLSVILSGTPQQLPKLLPSIEDGLWSRFCFYGFLPDNPESWKDVSPPARFDFSGIEQSCQSLSEKVYNLFKKLRSRKSDLNVQLQKRHWDTLNETGQTFKKRIFQQFGHSGVSVAHRMGLHIFRIAMVLAVWRKREEGADLGNVGNIEASDEDFEAALSLGKLYAEHSFKLMFTSPRKRLGQSLKKVQRKFYRELPDRFQTKEAVDLAGSLDISERSAKRYLKYMLEKRILIRQKRGHYRKP